MSLIRSRALNTFFSYLGTKAAATLGEPQPTPEQLAEAAKEPLTSLIPTILKENAALVQQYASSAGLSVLEV